MACTPQLAIVRPPLPVHRGHRALQRPRGLSVCSRRRSSSCTRLQAKDALLRAMPRAPTTVSARGHCVVRCHSRYVSRHRYPCVLREGLIAHACSVHRSPHTPLVLRPVAGSLARTALPRCGVDFVQSACIVVLFLLRIDLRSCASCAIPRFRHFRVYAR